MNFRSNGSLISHYFFLCGIIIINRDTRNEKSEQKTVHLFVKNESHYLNYRIYTVNMYIPRI